MKVRKGSRQMKFKDMPYQRVDLDKVKADFASLEGDFDKAGSGEEQFAVHQRYYRITDEAATQATIAEIRHDIDMTDEFYEKEQQHYDKIGPVLQNLRVSYGKKVYNSKFRPYLEEKIGPVAFKNMELSAKSVDEKILDLMAEENALQNEYNKLLATAKIPWEGQTLNLSLMTPYLHSPERRVRERAWKLYSSFFAENKEQMDDIYDRLVKNRTKQGQAMGYENYLPLGYARMYRNCYTRSDIADFRAQVKRDVVPFAERLHDRRRQRLGLDKLCYIDEGVYFTQGNPKPCGTPEEILENGRRMYNELSSETAEFMNFMCDNELFDVIGRKTKKTGGYMTYLPDYKAPFFSQILTAPREMSMLSPMNAGMRSRGIWPRRIRFASMRILRWKPLKPTPCPWNSLLNRGWNCSSVKEHRITVTCTLRIRSCSFLTEPWSMNSRILCIRIRVCLRKQEMKRGGILKNSTSRIWTIPAMNCTGRGLSGSGSIIFMTARSIILTTALLRQMPCSIRHGWIKTTAKPGTVT